MRATTRRGQQHEDGDGVPHLECGQGITTFLSRNRSCAPERAARRCPAVAEARLYPQVWRLHCPNCVSVAVVARHSKLDWNRPEAHMYLGRPTGSAMPLMWAHAEYVKLLRSITDGEVFDLIPAVAERYVERRDRAPLEVWKFNRRPRSVRPGMTLRVQASAAFRLRFTLGEWEEAREADATATAVGVHFADIAVPEGQRAPVRFTFFWPEAGRWEGRDFTTPSA